MWHCGQAEVSSQSSLIKWQVTSKYYMPQWLYLSVVRVIFVLTTLSEAFILSRVSSYFRQFSELGPGGKCVPRVKCVDHLTETLTLHNRKGSHMLDSNVENSSRETSGNVGHAFSTMTVVWKKSAQLSLLLRHKNTHKI